MKKYLLHLFAIILIFPNSFGQIVDRYGINIGTSIATQLWDYNASLYSQDNEYKIGLMAFASAESDITGLLSLRAEFGFIQKGFKNNLTLTFPDGTPATIENDNVNLNELALNLGVRIHPFNLAFSPYLLIGCRGEYLISYKDVTLEEQASGVKLNLYEAQLKDFKKTNFGGLVGLGLDIGELLYIEFEYNPNFTKNLDEEYLSIKDRSWGVKLGLNINSLVK